MKKHMLIDVTVSADPPNYLYYGRDLEWTAQSIESWVKEFHAFIRDHRSQDPVVLHVQRVYEDRCSFCGYKWEEDTEGPVCCNKAQEEWEAQHQTAS